MAGGLKTLQHLSAAALAAVASFAAAQALQDPTRPPATALEPTPTGAGAGTAVAGAASGFQAVIRRPGRKAVAVINGQMVELGGKLGDATLVKLSDTEAVLRGASGTEVLRLTPAAEKQAPQKAKPDAAKAKRQAGFKQADHD